MQYAQAARLRQAGRPASRRKTHLPLANHFQFRAFKICTTGSAVLYQTSYPLGRMTLQTGMVQPELQEERGERPQGPSEPTTPPLSTSKVEDWRLEDTVPEHQKVEPFKPRILSYICKDGTKVDIGQKS